MALLELEDATKRYGALTVVDGLSLHVDAGEALGVVGPNGAGKTTALSLISGDVPLTSGRVRLDGEDVTRRPAHARCRAGIGRTFQVPLPFLGMTVFENVVVGALHGRVAEGDAHDAAVGALERTHLLDRANVPAPQLTLLERKRLEVARALVTRPRVILLDESAGGLTEPEVQQLSADRARPRRRRARRSSGSSTSSTRCSPSSTASWPSTAGASWPREIPTR